MKKINLIIFIMFLLGMSLMNLASAVDDEDLYNYLKNYYTLDNETDIISEVTGTNSGGIFVDGVVQKAHNATGTDYFSLDESTYWNSVGEDMTLAVWAKRTADGVIFNYIDNTAIDWWKLETASGLLRFIWYNMAVESTVHDTKFALDTGKYYLIVITYNRSADNLKIYINNTLNGTWTSVGNMTGIYSADEVPVINNYRTSDTSLPYGEVDEFMKFNITFTQGNVNYVYNSGNGRRLTSVVPDTTPPAINYTTPSNNSIINDAVLDFIINVTDDSAFSQCCFLSNESDLLDTNCSVTQDYLTSLLYTTTISQVSSNIFNITCYDNAPNNNSASLFLNVSIDRVNPILTVSLPANNTEFDKTFENISYNIGCSDNNPYLLNFTLFNSSDNSVFSAQNDTPSNSNLNLTGEIDITSIPTGAYTGNFSCSDKHTVLSIANYDYVKNIPEKMIYFNTGNNIINISLISIDKDFTLNELYIKKYSDRYGFAFISDKGTPYSTYRFLLATKQKLIYIKNSDYNAHFISGTNWIDFENNDPNAKYSVYKINDNTYRITIVTDSLNFMSIGGLNIITETRSLTINETIYSSLSSVNFDIPSFTFASSSYIDFGIIQFNTSLANVDFILLNSFNLIKTSVPGQTNTISVKFVTDESVILEEEIRTLSSLNEEGSAGTSFFNFTSGSAGTHNITLSIRRTNNGNIEINDLDFILLKFISAHNNSITNYVNKTLFSTTSTLFSKNLNFTVTKGVKSNTAFLTHTIINSSAALTYSELIQNNENNISSPIARRLLEDNSDIGTLANSYIELKENQTHIHSINTKVTTGKALSNISIIYFDLRDSESNLIQGNSSSNIQTNDTNSRILGAGINLLTEHEITPRNSTSLFVFASASFQPGTGIQTPSFFINATNAKCSKKERYLSGNSDIGNAYIYTMCEGLTAGTAYNIGFYINISGGETISIDDESLSCIESGVFDIAKGNLAPIIIITFPENNSQINRTIDINFIGSDANDDNFLMNITLVNSSEIIEIAANLNRNIINYTFNFSTVAPGFYNLTIIAFENESSERLSSSTQVSIENILSVINISLIFPKNNSIVKNQNVIFTYQSSTSANCSLYLNTTFNQSMTAVSGANSFPRITLANMTWLWKVNCTNTALDLSGESKTFIFHINLITSLLDMTQCPVTTAGMLTLLMIVGISLFFILLGFMFKNGIIGFFGSIMLMVCSWYITPCQVFFAYIIALFSFVLMIWFAVAGLGFHNTTFIDKK